MAETVPEILDGWEKGMTNVKRARTEMGEIVSVSKDDAGAYQVLCGFMIGDSPVVSASAQEVDADAAIVTILDIMS